MRTVVAIVVGVSLLVLYGLCGLRGVGWDDTPEFALAVECHGVPHSPGFPLFVLLGRVVKVATGASGARAATLVASLGAASAAAVCTGLASARWGVLPGIVIGMGVGLSPVVWEHATHGEVYTLHLLLCVAVVAIATRPRSTRVAFGAAYAWGLALGNHPSALALGPLMLNAARRNLGLAALALVLACSVFAVLPVRSSFRPALDWGQTSSPSGLLWMLSLQEFREDALRGNLVVGRSLAGAAGGMWSFVKRGLPPLAWGLAPAAVLLYARRSVGIILSATLLVACTSLTGGGPDTDGYLLPLVPLLVWAAGEALERLPLRRIAWGTLACALGLLLPFQEWDRSRDRSALGYVGALASSLDGRILFTDSTTDFFLCLHRAWQEGTAPRVVYTPYLKHAWYRRTLPGWVRSLPVMADPPYDRIVRASLGAGIEPVFTFSRLPAGALRVLVPEGWVLRGAAYDPRADREALTRWSLGEGDGSKGRRHRALRLAQGGQLLHSVGAHREAAFRFARSLEADPANTVVWRALVASLAGAGECGASVHAAAAFLRGLRPGLRTTVWIASALEPLPPGCPEARGLLVRLASSFPHSTILASHAARRALADGEPQAALEVLEAPEVFRFAELLNLRGVALLLLGREEEAVSSLRQALALAGEELRPRIGTNLALCLRRMGRAQEADSLDEALHGRREVR